jgi:hypothetical protein
MRLRTASTLVLLLLIAAVPAWAADYYVSPSGSGTTYTMDNPGSLTGALAAVSAGDMIYCLDGTYTAASGDWDDPIFCPANNGSSGNPITIKSYNLHGAYLAQRNIGVPGINIYGSKSYIVIDGIKADGIQVHSSSHITIKNCEVINGYIQGGSDTSLHWGIEIQDSNNCLIQNNYVHGIADIGNGSHNTAGIMVFASSDNNVIEYNSVDAGNLVGACYGMKGGSAEDCSDDNVWRYNFGINAALSGFFTVSATAGQSSSGWAKNYRNQIHHNVIINCSYFLSAYSGTSALEVYNNSFRGCTKFIDFGYVVPPNCTNEDFTVYNNLGTGLTHSVYYRDTSSPTWLTTDFFTYFDYNQMNDVAYWGRQPSGLYDTLASWVSHMSSLGVDAHSSETAINYLNGSGSWNQPSDLKRSSYPTDGRGGSYPSVKGAYETGSEIIGYSEEEVGPPNPTPSLGPGYSGTATVH